MFTGAEIMLSLFIRDPQFQSQTKDRLTSPEATRLVENAIKDHFDHWLTGSGERGKALLAFVVERMEDRLRRRAELMRQAQDRDEQAQSAPARQADRLRAR